MADKIKYHTEWCKEHTTQFKLRLNNNTDADIIDCLKDAPNKQGYIKELIRADIARSIKESADEAIQWAEEQGIIEK